MRAKNIPRLHQPSPAPTDTTWAVRILTVLVLTGCLVATRWALGVLFA